MKDQEKVPPWNPPTPEEKQPARPLKHALKKALAEVDSPEKAEEVAEKIETATEDKEAAEILEETPPPDSIEEAARKVERVAETSPEEDTTKKTLTEAAKQVMTAKGRDQEVLSDVVHEAASPAQEKPSERGEPEVPHDLLREAILRRMAPYDALDARLFLAINHLTHTHFTNRFFYFLTYVFNGGAAWYALIALIWVFNRQLGKMILQTTLLPLTLSTMIVEFPVKSYFRRKRPFIKIVHAIVIGKKPGTWSFPSGHSASAFAGAWLLQKHFPKQASLLYLIAGMVAFSRIFLGNHYPGDVVSGSVVGLMLAKFFRNKMNIPQKG